MPDWMQNTEREHIRNKGEEKMAEFVIASTYEVLEEIGAGGSGTVFLANHLRLGKKVILKAYNRKITARPELIRREVDILKDLSHSYIPNVYDFIVEDDAYYTVMDYIEGESLDRPLQRGEKFSQPQVIQWAKQLLEALCYLHSETHGTPPKGYVHSDIKPANLMRRPNNEICLIDFNIALALGEENVIGCSSGYASPEHYGLDYSSGNTSTHTGGRRKTMLVENSTSGSSAQGTAGKRRVIPDVRSDIYSTGATLYHLLSGKRPSGNAKEVVLLSEKEYSPQVVKIISKAMNPNPDLRYQTAEEMLWDFSHLHERDPRIRRLKRNRLIAGVLFSSFFAAGAFSGILGLKRMETTENWLKLAEYGKTALANGDATAAIEYALAALPEETTLWDPAYPAEAQRVLAEALGVYDLADGYKMHKTAELPSAPLFLKIAPDGKTACCVYAYSLAVIDTDSGEILVTLPAEESALAEADYLDNHTIVYAGKGGLEVYDIEKNQVLWKGKPATSVSISGDKKKIVAVYKEESFASVYQASDGTVVNTIDFAQKHQRVTTNDRFANPKDHLLVLNQDGTQLGVSFADGSLQVYSLTDAEEELLLLDETSGYTHFEGGFYQQYFAFSASNESDSIFAVIDTEELEQTGGFESQSAFGVQADESGIYVQNDNLLVKIHPVTGEQTPLVTTSESILHFSRSDIHTFLVSQKEFQFFDKNANLISHYKKEYNGDFIQIAEGMALIGNRDTPMLYSLKYENYADTEVFSYDISYTHDEARVSADKETVMLFSYDRFWLFQKDGTLIQEVLIPDAAQVYDQQFIRGGNDSKLEVFYNDGSSRAYSAKDGSVLYEKNGEKPDAGLYEEFFTDQLRIASPLHGTPIVYNRNTGKQICELEEDAYLTYITQAGEFIVAQYVTAEGDCYGQLLNGACEVIADLPYLCDIIGEELFFDYPTGNIRSIRIYNREELVNIAQNKIKGGR